MRKWRVQFFLMGIMVAVFISNGPGISQAAHFSLTGTSSIHVSKTKSITLTGACNSAMDVSTPSDSTTIQPDPGESVGQAVTVNYCYSGSGTTSVTGAGYRAAGGIGSSTLTASCPFSYSNPNPLVALLNPGPSQQTVFSYGPQTITGNQNLSVPNTCGNIAAHIGDTLELDAGAFGVLDGPSPSPGTSAPPLSRLM